MPLIAPTALFAAEHGRSDLPSVVLLHGAGVSGWMWRPQLVALGGFHCLVPDLPGSGLSRSLRWTTLDAAVDLVAELIERRAHGGRAHLVGASLGGITAIELLARHPSLVDRVMVTGTLAVGLPGAALLGFATRAMMPLARSRWSVDLSAKRLAVPPSDQSSFAAEVANVRGTDLAAMIMSAARFRANPELRSRPHEVLVLAGDREHPRVRRSVGHLLELIPNATGGLVSGAEHTWHWPLAERFNAAMRAWLEDGVWIGSGPTTRAELGA